MTVPNGGGTVRTIRVDPAALPAAGVRATHDTANEDYRFTLAQSPTGGSLTATGRRRMLQKSDTLRGQPISYPAERLPPPEPSAPPRNKPDHHFIDDIPHAAPAPRPGLTLILPMGESKWQQQQQQQQQQQASGSSGDASGFHASPGTASSRPPPMRETNPLTPSYPWNEAGRDVKVYPMSASCSLPDLRSVRSLSLETGDISGASAQKMARTRRDYYSNFDYSDVAGTASGPSSPIKRRMQANGRSVPGPIDTGRLGLWAGALGGNVPPHMLATAREPCNPMRPSYAIYGAVVSDDPSVGRPKQLVLPAETDPARRSWHDSGEAGFVATMQGLQATAGRSSPKAGASPRTSNSLAAVPSPFSGRQQAAGGQQQAEPQQPPPPHSYLHSQHSKLQLQPAVQVPPKVLVQQRQERAAAVAEVLALE